MQLNIWDTAGDERFRSIMPLYYRDAEIALLVFDLTDAESFKGIDYWLGELESKVSTEGILLCNFKYILGIVGNKKDLTEERRVSKE
jgi:GTPase SAR1 family protein